MKILQDWFNPYFTGLPILIQYIDMIAAKYAMVQSLFYWITYSYHLKIFGVCLIFWMGSILILLDYLFLWVGDRCLLKRKERGSILILLDYLFL